MVTRHTPCATITVQYDGEGNRVSKTVATATNTVKTFYIVDDLNPTGYAQVLEEYTSQNAAAPVLQAVYNYGHTLISQDRWNGGHWSASFYGCDGHNNVRYLTDANGNVTATYDYDAFGNLIAVTGTTENLHLFTGEQYDPDLGLYYLRARYHNTDTGRFWNMDSYEGRNCDPTSLHKYTYCENNPANQFDPTGNDSFIESMQTIGQAVLVRSAVFAVETIAKYGAYTEGVALITAISYWQMSQSIITGKDSQTGEDLGAFELGLIYGGIVVDLAGGKVLRSFPIGSTFKGIRNWMRVLYEEHVQDASATRKAMQEALKFSEAVIADSVVIGGKGVKGADIRAKMKNGQTLAREVTVFKGSAKNIFGKILEESEQTRASGADIRQIYVQITDNVKDQPGWLNTIKERAKGAADHLKNVLNDATDIIVVDGNGDQLYP